SRLPPRVGPQLLSTSVPDNDPEIARRGNPGAIGGEGEGVDPRILKLGGGSPARSPFRQPEESEPFLDFAACAERVQIIAFAGGAVEALDGEAARVGGWGESECVADAISPRGFAAREVDPVEVVVPVKRVEDRRFPIR